MKSPLCSCKPNAARSKRHRLPIAIGRGGLIYKGKTYHPQYAIGIVCRDEIDQRQIYGRLIRQLPGHDLKVLVI